MCRLFRVQYNCSHVKDIEIESCEYQPRLSPSIPTFRGEKIPPPPPTHSDYLVNLAAFTNSFVEIYTPVPLTPEWLVHNALPEVHPARSSVSQDTGNTYYTHHDESNVVSSYSHECKFGLAVETMFPPMPTVPLPTPAGKGGWRSRRVDVCDDCMAYGWWGRDMGVPQLERTMREIAREQQEDEERRLDEAYVRREEMRHLRMLRRREEDELEQERRAVEAERRELVEMREKRERRMANMVILRNLAGSSKGYDAATDDGSETETEDTYTSRKGRSV